MDPTRIRRSRTPRAGGFTLVEVLICAVLLAVGFCALVSALGHDAVVTQRGEDTTLATFLADEVREMALRSRFSDVLALDGVVYNPAILSTGGSPDLANWSQTLHVTPVSSADLNKVLGGGAAMAARLTVEVKHLGTPVVTQTYYVVDMEGIPFTDGSG